MPECVDVTRWQVASKEQHLAYIESIQNRDPSKQEKRRRKRKSGLLAVRSNISMVDIYTYLKGRFGQPNGFQTFIKRPDTSDNYIHWDYLLCAGACFINIAGFNREFHILVTERMLDADWRALLVGLKTDFGRWGKEKSAVFKSLEPWLLYPNRFAQIASSCADLHGTLTELAHKPDEGGQPGEKVSKRLAWHKRWSERATTLGDACLKLSLLTPVLAEAFVNMVVLVLCKSEIRNSTRRYDAYIREQIDIKVLDLHLKCDAFTRGVSQADPEYVAFKRVMDRRNNTIHGNVDPERDGIERVFFDGFIPLYKETGDHIGHFFDVLERQFDAPRVLQDYEDIHIFFEYVFNLMDDDTKERMHIALADPYPGYRLDMKKSGNVLPAHVSAGYLQGIKYDDQLAHG